MAVRSLVWLGVRTQAYEEMVALYRDLFDLEVIRETERATWFRMVDGNEVHVYALGDLDHDFFGAGPMVGFLVDDITTTRRRMIEAGIEFIGEPQHDGDVIWNHYRAPDGNIYEIMERPD